LFDCKKYGIIEESFCKIQAIVEKGGKENEISGKVEKEKRNASGIQIEFNGIHTASADHVDRNRNQRRKAEQHIKEFGRA